MSHASEEFPSEPVLDSINNININSKLLKDIIKSTLYAASKDDLKPVLQGVLFNIKNQSITSVATDGHRLVKTTAKVEGDYNHKVIVPSKFLSSSMLNRFRLLSKVESKVCLLLFLVLEFRFSVWL